MSTKVTDNLAAAIARRAIDNAAVADRSIAYVTGVVRRHWDRIVSIIRKPGGTRQQTRVAVQAILEGMVTATEAAIENELVAGAGRGWDTAFAVWADNLPAEWWKVALSNDPEVVLLESVEFDFDEPVPGPGIRSKDGQRPVRVERFKKVGKGKGKTITKASAPPSLPTGAKLSKPVAAKVKAKVGPKTGELLKLVRSRGWKTRMRKWSSKVTNLDKVAEIIAEGKARGWKLETIVNKVKPFVQNYAASARRLVRTEIAALENKQLEKTFEVFDDVIAGYQIINPLDERTRPTHAIRAGRIYWKDERKKYTASMRPSLPDAANCRCTYAPILRDIPPPELAKAIPTTADPRTYAGWFNKQPDDVKRKVVGGARWDAMKDKADRPSWYDAVDPKSGELINVAKLKGESEKQTLARRNRVKKDAVSNAKEARKSLERYAAPQ